MTVDLTIVGIRNYCKGGEEGYPALFARLPIGSTVFLRKEPTGSKYPGSVTVWDDSNQQIGNISKTERRFIELEIAEGEMLPATISGHSAEHNCMYIQAENTKGVKAPYIREIMLKEGETVFPLTDYDQKILQLTSMMKTKIKMLKNGKVKNTESLLATAHEYTLYCCGSLDGETSFNREDILIDLKCLAATYPELNDVHSAIFELHKDIGRKDNVIKTETYLDQYNRIKDKAFSVDGKSRSQMDDYIEKLKFANSGKLSKEIIEKEIADLSALLSNEMMKCYEKNTETDETFATALYSLNYSMQGIYRLFTRRIKLDYLKKYIRREDWNTKVEVQDDKECNMKRSRTRVRATKETEARTREVFRLNNSTLTHMQLLWIMLTGLGWVKDEDGKAWLDLFGGKPCDCVVTWTGKVGVGTLKELFAQMISKNIIQEENNYVSIIESHFKDATGNYLTNVKGGKPNDKTSAEIALMLPKLKNTYDITDGIGEDFSDIRYGQKQYWDEHKERFD